MSGYGPLASMANIGTTGLASLFSKDLGDYVGKTFDNPLIGKIAGIALPALLAGGTGAMFGGKYGWGNAIPAAAMGLMSYMGDDGAEAQTPAPTGPGMGEGGVNTLGVNSTTYDPNDPTSVRKQSIYEAATGTSSSHPQETKPTQTQRDKVQTSSGDKGIMGSLGDLMNDPIGKLLISMTLANMTSGALGNASGAEYQYNQQRNRAKDAYNKQLGDQAYIRSWYS